MLTTKIRGHFVSFCVAATLLAAGCVAPADAAVLPDDGPEGEAQAALTTPTPELAALYLDQAIASCAGSKFELLTEHDTSEALNDATDCERSVRTAMTLIAQLPPTLAAR